MKLGRDTPSPGDTPYMCRQRTVTVSSTSHRLQELNEMEKGALLETQSEIWICKQQTSTIGHQESGV
ncbi:Cation efflux family [Popillia japonica]|uniref:Cation efflux family n=1 Tax=Popillia japonica TaxID=7064 RepID=A0AAW1HVZ5_POPJA